MNAPAAPKAPTFAQVEQAQRTVDRYLPRTPLVAAPGLFPRHDGGAHLKLDALSALGSFKARGVLCRLDRLPRGAKANGVVTASTGNHGLAVAWAARQAGIAATVVLPRSVPEFKADRIRAEGATVVRAGADWNASLVHAQALADKSGAYVIEDGSDPWVMAGAGTMVLEALRERPDIDCVVLPVGGGNLIAGGAIAARGLRRNIRIVGVQASQAQGVYRSWKRGRVLTAPCDTFAGGIATTGPTELAFGVIEKLVDDIRLVTEAQMLRAIGDVARHLSIVIEGAAAAPIACMRRDAKQFTGRDVGLMVTGRNLDAATLRKALAQR